MLCRSFTYQVSVPRVIYIMTALGFTAIFCTLSSQACGSHDSGVYRSYIYHSRGITIDCRHNVDKLKIVLSMKLAFNIVNFSCDLQYTLLPLTFN